MLHEKRYNNYTDLAKAINSIPDNHDDREEVIKDMIKQYEHAIKYDVYRNLTKWKGAGLDWIFSGIIEPKLETHKTLKDKWCYGTYYSIRRYGREKPPEGESIVPSALSEALEDIGATVTITTYKEN